MADARRTIIDIARRYGIDPYAAIAVAMGEGGLRNRANDIGDTWQAPGSGSFGPFQLYTGGALPSRFRGNPRAADSWAWSPEGIEYAITRMVQAGAKGLRGRNAVETIIRKFERPADPEGSIAKAWPRYQNLSRVPLASSGVRPPRSGASPMGIPAGSTVNPGSPASADPRMGAALALLDFATSRSPNKAAQLSGAVSRLGTVQPPAVVERGKRATVSTKKDPVVRGVADRVLAAAHTQVGKPYVFGSGPSTDSFDCSDLVQWAWKQVGVDIPRTTYEQMKVLPKKSWNNLSPGDLIYKNDGGHVVMYVGGGKVIAAPYTGTVVQYQPVSRFRSGNYHVRSVV